MKWETKDIQTWPPEKHVVGAVIPESGNATKYKTGGWRSERPVRDEEKCKQCLFCYFYCPDSSVIVEDGRAVGVRYREDGEDRELRADEVVLAAGALDSPAILLRSGIDRPGVGQGLQDHPSLPVALHLRDGQAVGPDALAVSACLQGTHSDTNDLQLLALDAVDVTMPSLGLLMGAVMRVHSRGSLRLASADPTVHPIVELNMLADERDMAALHAAATLTERVATSTAMAAIAEVAPFDLSDGALRAGVGDYVHAVGTCRMGSAADEAAVVDTRARVIGYDGLLVCDASVMPAVPRANTHLPVVMVAERVAAFFDRLG